MGKFVPQLEFTLNDLAAQNVFNSEHGDLYLLTLINDFDIEDENPIIKYVSFNKKDYTENIFPQFTPYDNPLYASLFDNYENANEMLNVIKKRKGKSFIIQVKSILEKYYAIDKFDLCLHVNEIWNNINHLYVDTAVKRSKKGKYFLFNAETEYNDFIIKLREAKVDVMNNLQAELIKVMNIKYDGL